MTDQTTGFGTERDAFEHEFEGMKVSPNRLRIVAAVNPKLSKRRLVLYPNIFHLEV